MVNSAEVLKIAKIINPAIRKNDNLISSGIYNSIEVVSLVVELEDAFQIQISPLDINLENFNTIDSITELVNRYLGDNNQKLIRKQNTKKSKAVPHKSKEKELKWDLSDKETGHTQKMVFDITESVLKTEVSVDIELPTDAETVLDFLTNIAEKQPDKTAVVDEFGGSLTFSEMLIQAKHIGEYLRQTYSCEKQPFVVLQRRNANSIAMMLGILWSGNYYISVDENLSYDEINYYLEICKPTGILWEYNPLNNDIFGLNCEVILYDDLIYSNVEEESCEQVKKRISADDPMYGVFTSGTTSAPKCIIKSHGAMAQFIKNYTAVFGFTNRDILGSKLSLMFDAVTKDIYTMLYCGAKMIIMPRGQVLPPQDAQLIENEQITSVVWTPSLLKNFERLHIFNEFKMSSLKRVLFVGEVLPQKYINYWFENRPDIQYVNLYGTSEMTGNCLYKFIDAETETPVAALDSVFPGYEVFLMNDEFQEVTAPGEIGELCVGGPYLYLEQITVNDDERAAENNNCAGKVSERIYKTGDLVQILDDGSYLFVSRNDYMFKHAGHRMSSGEIENRLADFEYADNIACLYDNINAKIILFWSGDQTKENDLYEYVNRTLPSYMLPGEYIWLQDMPHNNNGKIDRAYLETMIRNRK